MKNQEIIFKNNRAESFTRTLISAGHDQAASSFAMMLGQEVVHGELFMQVSSNPIEVPGITKGDGQLTLAITEIMGELKGKSYLILNEAECEKIKKLCLGENCSGINGWIESELLKELDNILSAAVITEFSNTLNVQIYGDVPQIFNMEVVEIETMIRDDLNEDFVSDLFITTDIKFVLGGNEIYQPQLIWKLAEPFFFLVHQQAQMAYQRHLPK